MEIKRLNPSIGAVITGVELRKCDAAMAADIRAVLLEHLVVFFRDQSLDEAELMALGRCFGDLFVGWNDCMSGLWT